MTRDEAIQIVAVITANWWQGRDMSDATAGLYVERLQLLNFDDAMSVVMDLIDTSTSRNAPTIGQIRDAVRLLHMPARQQTPALPSGGRITAPWFIQLQAARQKRGVPAGIPLQELQDGEQATAKAELAAAGLRPADFAYWRERSKGLV